MPRFFKVFPDKDHIRLTCYDQTKPSVIYFHILHHYTSFWLTLINIKIAKHKSKLLLPAFLLIKCSN